MDTFFRLPIPPDCESFLLLNGERGFNWRKIRSIPDSVCGLKVLFFFFKELSMYFKGLAKKLNLGNVLIREIFFGEFQNIFCHLKSFPFIGTSFPSIQDYVLVVGYVPVYRTPRLHKVFNMCRRNLNRFSSCKRNGIKQNNGRRKCSTVGYIL
jgi:hypothetical protein